MRKWDEIFLPPQSDRMLLVCSAVTSQTQQLCVHKVHSTPKSVALRETHYTQLLTKTSKQFSKQCFSLTQTTHSIPAATFIINPPAAPFPRASSYKTLNLTISLL